MPPQLAARVFEPFFTTKPEGTGLGLAMVYAFAQRHRGTATLDTAPGGGTRVRIWFPGVTRG
jgi:signal transduction histidine kinase